MKNANKIKSKWKFLEIVAIASLIIGLIILLFFFRFLWNNFDISSSLAFGNVMENTGNVGDFFGGVIGSFWALAGVFLLFLTLKMQREELANQRTELQNTREVFEIQKFENTFFNLLEHQRKVLAELAISVPECSKNYKELKISFKQYVGTSALNEAINQLNIIIRLLSSPHCQPYDDKYFKERYDDIVFRFLMDNNPEEINVDFENTIFKEEFEILSSEHEMSYFNFHYKIQAKDKHIFRHGNPEIQCKIVYAIFFEIYGQDIGHYFRNLYHILNFLQNTEIETVSQNSGSELTISNYSYFLQHAKFVQAQMSSRELLMLFYNSACFANTRDLVKKYEMMDNLSADLLLDERHNDAFGLKVLKRDSLLRKSAHNSFDAIEPI